MGSDCVLSRGREGVVWISHQCHAIELCFWLGGFRIVLTHEGTLSGQNTTLGPGGQKNQRPVLEEIYLLP